MLSVQIVLATAILAFASCALAAESADTAYHAAVANAVSTLHDAVLDVQARSFDIQNRIAGQVVNQTCFCRYPTAPVPTCAVRCLIGNRLSLCNNGTLPYTHAATAWSAIETTASLPELQLPFAASDGFTRLGRAGDSIFARTPDDAQLVMRISRQSSDMTCAIYVGGSEISAATIASGHASAIGGGYYVRSDTETGTYSF